MPKAIIKLFKYNLNQVFLLIIIYVAIDRII